MIKEYKTKDDVVLQAETILRKSLRDVIPTDSVLTIEKELERYNSSRKGYLGDLVEQYVFGLENNGRPEADFYVAGVELKTTPLKKHAKNEFAAKERLVFSMIDYDKIVQEKWETSSFLQKNNLLLLMFYLYLENASILDYEFKFIHLLELLNDISKQDVEQIKKDWQFIVDKIKRGEAHLLSEADTYYLGACTKAKNSRVLREQPKSRIPAKPRAFSLKQTYLNFLIQSKLLGKDIDADSIYKGEPAEKTIKEVIADKFKRYIGKTDTQIMSAISWSPTNNPKNYKRLLVNHILIGTGSNKIEELEKANITLKVITLEHTGKLRESLPFRAFDYKDLATQIWYDDEAETMSDFHAELEMNKFLFVIFQKIKGSDEIILKKIQFWNFPIQDLAEAERVFDKTIDCINSGRYEDLPKMSESPVAHVRPHAQDAKDTLETPQHTQEIKRCFWLNSKYIEKALGI